MHTLKPIQIVFLRTMQGKVLTPVDVPLKPGTLVLDLRDGCYGPLKNEPLKPETIAHAVPVKVVGTNGRNVFCPHIDYIDWICHN